MKSLITIAVLLICVLYKGDRKKDITTIRVTKKIPMLNNIGKVDKYIIQDAYVYFNGNMRLYETPYYYDSIVNNEKVKSDIRYKIFVHHKDSLYGSAFDTLNNIFNKRMHKDSFSSINYYTDLRLIKLFDDEILVMQSSEKNANAGIYKETYLITSRHDVNKTGLAVFGYDSMLNNIDFSFSKELDSIHRMKLYEVMIQTNAHFINANGLKIDTLKVTHKMELIKVPHLKNADDYFSLYTSKLKQ